jgi:hypothetical protein
LLMQLVGQYRAGNEGGDECKRGIFHERLRGDEAEWICPFTEQETVYEFTMG